MIKKLPLSSKRLQIDKANATVVITLAVTSFITVFSLVATVALLSQRSYQARVINEKRDSLAQLKKNNEAASKLVDSYKVFVSTADNVIGGSSTGSGDKDGNNGKIILDALPSKYDFPALITSIEKIITSNNIKIDSISGSDDEINQASTTNTSSIKPVEVPFQVSVSGDAASMNVLIDVLRRSIRPIKISTLTLAGKDNALNVTVSAKTYWQPQKTVNITSKVVK